MLHRVKNYTKRIIWAGTAFLFALTAVMPMFPVGKARAAVPPVSFTETIIEDDTAAPEDPWLKTLGDLNGDGIDDMIVGGNAGGGLVWYESPAWEKHVIASSGSFSTDGEVTDVDGDGDLDIVVNTSSSTGSTRWYENPGDPTQSNWNMHTIGSTTVHDIEVDDLDKDGTVEVIARNQSAFSGDGDTIYIYQQTSPTSWTELPIASPNGEGLHVADVDADNDADIIVNGSWFENPGTISDTWVEHTYTTSWTHPHVIITFADINNDGRKDIALSPAEPENTTYRISWFEAPADRTQTWTEHTVLDGVESVVHSIGAADFNQDGFMDIAAAEMSQSDDDDEVYVLLGNGGGSWEKTVLSTEGSHSMRIFDANDDGYPDLFGANWRDNGRDEHVKLWTNDGAQGASLDSWTYIQADDSRDAQFFGLAMKDMTGDGYKDVLSGKYFYENPGGDMTGSWQRTTLPAAVDALMAVNVDDDGLEDFIAMDSTGKVYWFEAVDAALSDWNSYQIGDFGAADHNISAQGFAVEQLVGGGKPEVIINLAQGVHYFTIPTTNPEAGNWPRTLAAELSAHGGVHQENFGLDDFDGDGDLDIAVSGRDRTYWYENPGDGSGNWPRYVVGDVFPGDAHIDRTATADMNGDGTTDIVLGLSNDSINGVYWFESPADPKTGTWTLHEVVQQNYTNNIDLADMDFDGDTDIISAEHRSSTNSEKLAIWENDGAGNFTEHVVDTGKESHGSALTSDLDNDGDLDIVSIAWDEFQYLHIWRNDAITGGQPPVEPDVVDVWHGNTQTFGDKGTPQNWVNILGTADSTVTGLSYTLNGGASRSLELGPDGRRLAGDKDFNIDLATSELNPGANTVTITANDSTEGVVTEDVTVNFQNDQTWELPYTADWSAANQVSDAAQVVDGPWTLDANGLRSSTPAYDRLALIGDVSWADYEVTVPVTINSVDFDGAQATGNSGTPAVGLVMRWAGHTDNPVTCTQPKCGWEPLGEIGWWRWNSDESTARLEYYNKTQTPLTPQVGVTYMMKQRVETQSDGTSIYSMKVWESGQTEPANWSLTYHETDTAGHLNSGSLGLIAHHVDATYGNVTVTDLSNPDETPPVISDVAAANVAETSADITWTTDEAADSQVEYGLDTNYGNTTPVDQDFVTSHNMDLSGLNPDTTYHYRVISKDASGNQSVSADFTFTTPAPDTTAPVVSNVASSNITASGATITWDTDEPADSQVEYGTDTSYGNTTPLDSTLVTAHSVSLSSLAPETTYHYRVISKDGAGNTTASDDHTFTTAALPPSLEAHWTFDETSGTTAADSSGFGRDGTLQQGASFAAGNNGNAVNLDGSDDYVGIAPFDVTGQELTISAWINPEQFTGSYRDNRILAKATTDTEQDHFWMLSGFRQGSSDTVLRFRLKTGGNTTTLVASTGNIPLNEWSHAVARYDGSTMKLYLNGEEVGSTSKSGDLSTDDTVGVNIGRNPSGYGEWNGLIDDTRIYSRALSETEIQDLFDGTPDTTAPEITNITSTNVAHDGATITWDTDEAADSQVEYGLDTNYGNTTPLDTSLVTNHSINLSGLTPETTYHYRVLSKDAASNPSVSGNFTFTTPAAPDTTAPAITNVASNDVTENSATITWDTDETATSQVEYGTTTAYGNTTPLDSTLVTSHSVDLDGLASDTTYHYRVISTDAAGNESISEDFTFTTDFVPDTTPPQVSDVNAGSITTEGATVTWTTDEPADSQVEYGTDTNYGSVTPLDQNLTTGHSVELSGLADGTTYHYRVLSRDAADNLTVSADFTFTTEAITLNVDAGSNQTVTLGQAASLAATVDYNGQDTVNATWSQDSGPGTVNFSDSSSLTTDATADAAGTYVLRVTVTDGTLTSEDTLTLIVEEEPAIDPDLVAHWLFDETSGTTAADETGNHDATLQQGASFGPGYDGNAVSFDGSDDYVDAGAVDVSGQALTLAAWINPSQFTGSYRDNRIISKAMSDAEQDHFWMLSGIKQGTDTVLRFRLKTDGVTHTLIANIGNISLSEWSHVAATYDGSTMRLYLNGVEVGSTSKSGEISTDPNVNVRIGSNPSGYGPWDGQIDDVRIYSRALTGTELQQLAIQ